MRDISKNIRALRTARGLTQEELAAALHVTRQTVSNYENGRSRPDIDMVLRIAQALEADANDVLYGPAALDPRKQERKHVAIMVGICLVLVMLFLLIHPEVRALGAFSHIYCWLRYAYLPALMGLIGWTIMAVLGYAKRIRPLDPTLQRTRWARIGMIVILAIIVALLAPMIVYHSIGAWHVIETKIFHIVVPEYTLHFPSIPFYNRVTWGITMFLVRYPVIFLPLGSMLWVFWGRQTEDIKKRGEIPKNYFIHYRRGVEEQSTRKET